MVPMLNFLGLDGLICSNNEDWIISKNTVLFIYGKGHEHNRCKLEVNIFMSVLLFCRVP